jgi:hypothetical protein
MGRTWVGVAVLAVGLAGCSGGATPAASSSTSVADRAFVASLRSRFPHMTEAVMFKERKDTCDAMASDPTPHGWVSVVKVFTDQGIAADDAGYFIGAAVLTGCPQYRSALPNS